jgi:hypothetical protein
VWVGRRLVAEKEERMLVVEGSIVVDRRIRLLRIDVEDSLVEVGSLVVHRRRRGRIVLAAVVAGRVVAADLLVQMVVVHLV